MDNDHFGITFYKVSSSKLSSNMRAVLISDMHMSYYGEENSELLDAVARLNPDFIAVTGDSNTYRTPGGIEYTKKLCESLVQIAPTYYALGNHELEGILYEGGDYKKTIKDTGVILLDNSTVETEINGNAVTLGGLTPIYTQAEQYAAGYLAEFTSKGGYKILLTHYPEGFAQGLQNESIDLAMCGHAHGGLIRLPYVGAIYAPDQGFLPDLTEGVHTYGNLNLVISRGLGVSSAIPRFNNEPELVVVDMCTY